MKRNVITLLATFLLAAIPAQAVKYRGFVDFNLGGAATDMFFYGDSYNYEDDNYRYSHSDKHPMMINWGFTTSHGLQISKNFFAGIGVGVNFLKNLEEYVYGSFYCYQIGKPAGRFDHVFYDDEYIWGIQYFVHLRWDGFGLFGIQRKISPFVELKAGYFQSMSSFRMEELVDRDEWSYPLYQKNFENSFFIRPSIGVRLRLTGKLGLNFGLYCEPFCRFKLKAHEAQIGYWNSDDTFEGETIQVPSVNFNFFPFGINVGLDF